MLYRDISLPSTKFVHVMGIGQIRETARFLYLEFTHAMVLKITAIRPTHYGVDQAFAAAIISGAQTRASAEPGGLKSHMAISV